MPSQVPVFRTLEFKGQAKHAGNVSGPMQPKNPQFFDDFTKHTLDTSYTYTSTAAGAAATNAINAAVGGHLRLTTSSTDDATQMVSTAINYEGDKNAVCEARIRINDVSQTAIFFGFSDATSETTPQIAMDYEGDSYHADADNAVGFIVDADSATLGTSSILCAGVAATTKDGVADSGVDWADAEWHVLRVELFKGTTNCTAAFFLDGVAKGFCDNACLTATDLCVTIQAATREAGSGETVDVDYIFAYEDR